MEDTMVRKLLIAWVAVVTTASAGHAQTMSAACAERDLQVVAFIEERGDRGDLSADRLGELGLRQLQARLICIAGQGTVALAIYDDILSAVRTVKWVKP